MNLPCLGIQLIGGAAGGNLACCRFVRCKMGLLVDSLLGILGGYLGGQVCQQLFASNASASELDLFLSCVGGGFLGGALLTGMVGLLSSAWQRRS